MTAGVLPRLDVEFRTLDGLTLRALLLPASKRGPAMIMSPGVRTYPYCDPLGVCFRAPID
jgi:hypothetical protein